MSMETTDKNEQLKARLFAKTLYEKHETDTFKRNDLRELAHSYGFTKKQSYRLFITADGCRVSHGKYSIAPYLGERKTVVETAAPPKPKPKTKKAKEVKAPKVEKAKEVKVPKVKKPKAKSMKSDPIKDAPKSREITPTSGMSHDKWVDQHVKAQPLRRKKLKQAGKL